jgi:hypothetical protein
MPERDVWGELAQAFDGGLADVREKVEEALWGRAVTEPGQGMDIGLGEQQASMEPQALSGEVLGPEASYYNPSEYQALDHGQVIDAWAEASERSHTQALLEDRSNDQSQDIER